MGKQIAVVMNDEDELIFLKYLKKENEIILIESFAETKELLWKSTFENERIGHWSYDIWNKDFEWEPEYMQTKDKCQYYVSNTSSAPLIEYCRSDIDNNKFGRIYWSKDFSAPNGLDYDVHQFNKWYEKIIRWIRKNSAGSIKSGWVTYFLPNAWAIYSKKNS